MSKYDALRQIDLSPANAGAAVVVGGSSSGGGDGGNSDTVDSLHASAAPVAGWLYALDANARFALNVTDWATVVGDGLQYAASKLSLNPLIAGAGLTHTAGVLAVGAGYGITVNADDVALASGVAGAGLTYTNGVLAVGAGTLITVNADDVALSNGSAQYQVPVTGATPFAPTWTALSTYAGAGLAWTSNAYAVGAGDGITVNANDVALTTPGTLSVTSSNSAAGSHTHAITSSSAPGAAASLLASSAAGYLQLVRLGIGVAPGYPLHARGASAQLRLDQDAGNYTDFTISGTGDLTIAPSGLDIIIPTTVTHEASDWASQVTGWGIYPEPKHNRSGYADFRYIYADELHVKVFIADMEQALAGGQIIAKSVAKIITDFTIPNKDSTAYLLVEDLPGTTANVFADNDWVRIRNVSRSGGGLVVADAYGTVTFVSHTAASAPDPGYQRYIFARPAGDTGSAAGGTIVPRGGLALDYGISGDGYYEVTTLDAAGSPYAQIATWATHPQNLTVHTRMGQLDGLAGIGDEWGFWAGKDASHYVLFSDTHAQIVGLRQEWISGDGGGTLRGVIDPTATGTGDLFWLGPSSGDHRLTVRADGVVLFGSVPSGNVAGWAHAGDITKIDGGDIYAGSVTADKFNAHGANVLGNPGFETGTFAEWGTSTGAYISGAISHSGHYSAYVTGNSTIQSLIWQPITNIVQGANYYFGGWVVASGGATGTAGVIVVWKNAAGETISESTASGSVSGTWQHFTLVTVAPALTVSAIIYLTLFQDVTSGQVGFDDIEFYAADGQVLVGTPGGARVEITSAGLKGYSDATTNQFSISATTGKAVVGNPVLARVEINASGIEGYSDLTTTQFYLQSSNGKAMFGAGNCLLDARGITIDGNHTTIETYNSIIWEHDAANKVAKITGGLFSSARPQFSISTNENYHYVASDIYIHAFGKQAASQGTIYVFAGDKSSQISLVTYTGAGEYGLVKLNVEDGVTSTFRVELDAAIPLLISPTTTSLSGGLNVGTATGAAAGAIRQKGATGLGPIGITVGAGGEWLVGQNCGYGSGDDTFGFYSVTYGPSHDYAPILQLSSSGAAWVVANFSALSFTDRTPYPDLATALPAVLSMKRGEDKNCLDHDALDPYLKAGKGERNLSATVSAQNAVMQHLLARLAALEKQLAVKV